jgi:hypothetical protein
MPNTDKGMMLPSTLTAGTSETGRAAGVARMMAAFFAPAIALVNRLSYPRKFILISGLFGLPLALVVGLLFGEINHSLDIARRQTLGLRYLTGIQPLFRAVLGQVEASVAASPGEALEARRQRAPTAPRAASWPT